MYKKILFAVLVFSATLLASCAHYPREHIDPYQTYNREVFAFNMAFDHLLLRPLAKGYHTLIPPPVRKGVTNFFANVQMTTTIANDVFQFKFHWAFVDLWRLIINSTVGIAGIFDVASRLGFPKHYEDFGMTLARYDGNRPMPYFVVPVLGANTLRSAIGLPVDYFTTPWAYIRPAWIKYASFAMNSISTRANYLEASKLLDESFDPYVFMRSAYLQRRRQLLKKNMQPYKTLAERRRIEQQTGESEPPPPPLVLPGTTAVGDEHQGQIKAMEQQQKQPGAKGLPKPPHTTHQ